MKKGTKKILAIILCMAMVCSTITFTPNIFEKNIMALANSDIADSLVTGFSYEFAYDTTGYADGTIYVNAKEDGVYRIYWGDADGNKLKKNGYEYTYFARVIVKDGKGSSNIISDYTAIPEGAKTVLVYRKNDIQYVYDIPASRLFAPNGEGYTFGAMSDLHFGKYAAVYEDDAVVAVDNALSFFNSVEVDFVGMTGDITSGGEQASLDKLNAAVNKYPDMTVLTCMGNHDSRTTVSTSNKTALDASFERWTKSITNSYFTVDEAGNITNKLKGHDILATDALANPVTVEYRAAENEAPLTKTMQGVDFVTEAGGNIYIFFNEVAKTGEVYDTAKLITTAQMDWLEEQMETYRDKNVFLFFHSFMPINTLNNDADDPYNCTGDLKNGGDYSYDLDFKDVVTTTGGLNMKGLLSKYDNVTMLSGHSHWQYALQSINPSINIGKMKNGKGATLLHLGSVTDPRYIGENDESRTALNGYASEGSTITVYDDCMVYNCIDFYNNQYDAYATYIVPTGTSSKYEPVKAAGYQEAADEITGDEYLEADDMTIRQLLKSDYNLLRGAAYAYTSKGNENTDGALTDGVSTDAYFNSKENKNADQYVIFTLDGLQDVSNLRNFMIYFVNAMTDCASFNIQLSLDGENYETVGTYTNMTYQTTVLPIDTSKLSLEQYKYIKLNLTGGAKAYGYQIREFAAIGYDKNVTPNQAGSSSSLIEGTIDEEDYLASDYNLIYAADYTQSTVGGEDTPGALTNGKLAGGFANTERDAVAKHQEFVIDLGAGNKQSASNIDYFLLYSQNEMTNVTAFSVAISLDGYDYETIGEYAGVDIDTNHFTPTYTATSVDKFRYVKLTLSDGNTGYGYQIKEFAVIGVNPIEYPEVPDQSVFVASDKNLALNKTLYVSSTYANEGSDSTVLNDGKLDKYWSSDWDDTLTSDFIIVDLGEEHNAYMIDSVLVNFKSDNTFSDNYKIEFSNTYNPEDPTEGFYEVAKTKAVAWEALQKISDSNGYTVTKIEDAESAPIRYVKINMLGHKPYGVQIKEIAVIEKSEAPKDITSAQGEVIVGKTDFVYTGKSVTTDITVKYDNVVLIEDVDYTLTYTDNINVGTAQYKIKAKGTYVGTVEGTFTISTKNITDEDVVLNDTNIANDFTFTGEKITPAVSFTYNGKTLTAGVDFDVEYEDNCYPGTAAIILTGKGNFAGAVTRNFNIIKKAIEDINIYISFDYAGELYFEVTNGNTELVKDVDYTYTAETDAEGNITITFTGIGDNYSGTIVRYVEAENNPNRPEPTTEAPTTTKKVEQVTTTTKPIVVKKVKLKKAVNIKGRKAKISWKKIGKVKGYKIRYSLKRNFKKAKVKTVKKNVKKFVLKKLKKKKYYIQVRAYVVVNGKTYLGKWSKKKKVVIKK